MKIYSKLLRKIRNNKTREVRIHKRILEIYYDPQVQIFEKKVSIRRKLFFDQREIFWFLLLFLNCKDIYGFLFSLSLLYSEDY